MSDVDVLKRREAETILAAEEIAQSVVITNPALPDNPIVFVSPSFEEQTGYPAVEALGRNCRFLQGPGTDPRAVRRIRRAIERRKAIEIDLLNYRRDGTPFWNRLRIRPQYGPDGMLVYFIGAQNPIPEDQVRPLPFDVEW